MEEIQNSVAKEIKNRLTNSVYGTFFFSWLIFHWEFIYSLFFLDQEVIWNSQGLYKNDYLVREFFKIQDPYFWILWVAPFLLTWIIIWKLPEWILLRAYNKTEEYETEKKIILISQKRRLEQEEARLQEQTAKKTEAVAKKLVQEKKIRETDPTIEWEASYLKFKKLDFAHKFSKIIESYYKRSANISETDQFGNAVIFEIPEDVLAYAHSNDIVAINTKSNKIEVTPKGKYFINRYLEDPDKPVDIPF